MSLPFQRPPKMPSMIPPRFLHLRGSQQGMVWLTKMVSSPMTSISFHPDHNIVLMAHQPHAFRPAVDDDGHQLGGAGIHLHVVHTAQAGARRRR